MYQHTLLVCCSSHRVLQRKMVSFNVYKEGGWLLLMDAHTERFDSINTLVMYCATAAIPIIWYSHIFDTQYTHHSIISKNHLAQCESLS